MSLNASSLCLCLSVRSTPLRLASLIMPIRATYGTSWPTAKSSYMAWVTRRRSVCGVDSIRNMCVASLRSICRILGAALAVGSGTRSAGALIQRILMATCAEWPRLYVTGGPATAASRSLSSSALPGTADMITILHSESPPVSTSQSTVTRPTEGCSIVLWSSR